MDTEFGEYVKRWIPLAAFVLVIGLFTFIAEGLELPERLIEKPIRRLLVGENAELQVSTVSQFIFWIGAAGCVSLLAAIAYKIQWKETKARESQTRQDLSNTAANLQGANSQINELIAQTATLEERLKNLSEQPPIDDFFRDFLPNVERIKNSVLFDRVPIVLEQVATRHVTASGDLRTTIRRHIKAGRLPIPMLLIGISGRPEPLHTFREAGLTINLESGSELVVFPAVNEPNRKQAFLFLIPELAPGQEMIYSYSWQWPQAMIPLIEKGYDLFRMGFKADGNVPLQRYIFRMDQKLPFYRVSNIGHGGGKIKNPLPKPEDGIVEYEWTIENCVMGDKQIVLEFDRAV